jgi:hypothetical protein
MGSSRNNNAAFADSILVVDFTGLFLKPLMYNDQGHLQSPKRVAELTDLEIALGFGFARNL